MIVCKKCGTQNHEGESFCSSCGTFLEWSGERVSEPPAPPAPSPPPRPVEPAPPPTLVERVKQAAGLEERRPVPAADPIVEVAPPPSTAPAGSPPLAASAAPPTVAAPEAQQRPPAAPEARLPQAVPPAPRLSPPPRPSPARVEGELPGELVCERCGADNEAGRHFCRRCGATLVVAAPVRIPWWRRLLPAREAAVAGSRHAPRARRGFGGVIVLPLAAAVAALAVSYLGVPGFRGAVDLRIGQVSKSVQRQLNLGSYRPVRPVGVAATSVPGHPASALTDLISTDYWAADTATDPQPVIQLTFAAPTDVDYVNVTSGAGPDYAKLARPRDVRVTYSDGTTDQLTLQDSPKVVGYVLHGRNVKWMTIRVLDAYPAPGSSQVAIAELEFYRLAA